jgi:hypothetical protein
MEALISLYSHFLLEGAISINHIRYVCGVTKKADGFGAKLRVFHIHVIGNSELFHVLIESPCPLHGQFECSPFP